MEALTTYRTEKDILYRAGDELDDYARKRCRLDVYYPESVTGFSTVVWIHGGGLREQEKFIPGELMGKGIAVVSIGYRLDPHVKAPVYMEDAAAAVAWVLDHIAEYGGSRRRVFVSGHSAGCYLGDLITLDRRYLAAHGHAADELAGNISLSAHKIDHLTVRMERGLPVHCGLAGDLSPLYHVRGDAPPMLLVTGDRELELWGRYEENAYFWRMMKVAGHNRVQLHEIKGRDHGGMIPEGCRLLLDFVSKRTDELTRKELLYSNEQR